MEILIIRLEVLQNRDGLLDVSRFHDNLLESPVKSPVLLNNLGELVHSRGSDALELAAGQGRFQDIGRIQASLRATGSDNSVELVNKQDYVGIRARFLDYRFEALLEIPTVFRSGDNQGYIQGNQAFLGQGRGYASTGYPQCDPFDYRGLSYSGLADKHRVVLLAPPKDLYDTGNLGLPADNGVQFSFGGGLREVKAKVLDHALLRFGFLIGLLLVILTFVILLLRILTQHPLVTHIRQQTTVIHSVLPQIGLAIILGRAAKGQKKMQGVRLGNALLGSLQNGDAQDVLGITGERDLVRFRIRDRFVCEYMTVDEPLEVVCVNSQACHCPEGGVVAVPEDSQEQVVWAYAVAAGPHGFISGVADYVVEFVGYSYFHKCFSKYNLQY